MSSFVPRATPPTLAEPDPTKHVKYTLGMVLGVDDFTQEFAYLSGRDQWLARELLGYGTASGLEVGVEIENAAPQVLVTPGVAVSPRGQLIRVAPAQCADLNLWLTARREELARRLGSAPTNRALLRLYVVLCYRDCATDMVPIPGEPCRSQDETLSPSRLADDFKLELRFDAPDQSEEDALRDYVEWLGQVEVTDEPGSYATLEELEQAIRDAAQGHSQAPSSPPASPLDSPPSSPPSSPPDFFYGSPPEALRIHSSMAFEYLRAAFRLWATELRPRWQAVRAAGREVVARAGSSGDEDCVLLAELGVPIARAAAHTLWQVEDAAGVEVREERRPYLIHLRMLQELLLSGRRAGGGLSTGALAAGGGGPAIGPGFEVVAETSFDQQPNVGKRFDYARADHTHGTPPTPALAGDVTGPIGSTTVAAIRTREVDGAAPAENQVLTFKAGKWRPAALPAAPAPLKPAATVIPETAYSLGSTPGTSLDYARADHRHGTPPLPTLGGDVAGAANFARVQAIQNVAVDVTKPTANQVLTFDATLNRWRPAALPAPPPATATDAVTRPEKLPPYRIVAAGILPGAVGGANTYNNLRVTRVLDGLVSMVFDGFQTPAAPATQQYIVKALAVLSEKTALNDLTVAFAGFVDNATGFTLLVNNAGQRVNVATLGGISFMVEVSQFDVKSVTTTTSKTTKDTKETETKSTKDTKEKDTKETKDTKDTKETESKTTKDTDGKATKDTDTFSSMPAGAARSFINASDASAGAAGPDAEAGDAASAGHAFIREDERPEVGRKAIELADTSLDKSLDKPADKLSESGASPGVPGAVN